MKRSVGGGAQGAEQGQRGGRSPGGGARTGGTCLRDEVGSEGAGSGVEQAQRDR